MMLNIHAVTCSLNYGQSQLTMGKEPSPPGIPLQIDKLDTISLVPKGVMKRLVQNTNSQASQKYYIMQDLFQTSCAMSDLEVL